MRDSYDVASRRAGPGGGSRRGKASPIAVCVMTKISIDLPGLADTESLGQRLGKRLFAGAVVALMGPLGAGKTHLVRAIAEGLEIGDARTVSSPTFVLIQEYDARLPIYHFDAYRLPGVTQFAELGVHEYFEADGVCLVEWADRVASAMPAERLEARLVVTGETSRRLELTAHGKRYRELLAALATNLSGGR
jgi:tRNA threonylcarbamoyladenosine biosynthesis protein TsaE